ncbi:hypothetical protein CI109_105080 [Kwoniella shandongensis]|uniref:Uncharacterized protein n=1 Tax=Kwoniella shandongensis TaxID=1734106 RepID=A0A5M6BYG8_9TREE|nr:uncharacterized protein CI109_004320 [Kwoniella shandongensis]KAA5527260.1 hypothetical protein CI109_004320 [Kwoniella shandongensis]
MYASSSRILVRSALTSSRTFTTTSTCAAKRETFVELLQDVPGLGRTFDRLFVAPGRARNDLVPTRKARFVAFKDNSSRQVYRATDADRAILLSDFLIESPSSKPFEQRNSETDITPTPQHLLDALHLIPSTLVFHLRTISPDYPSLHGSLTLSDIQDRLANEFALPATEVEVNWGSEQDAGARMKELGRWGAVVKLRKGGREEVPIDIEVVRLEDGQ